MAGRLVIGASPEAELVLPLPVPSTSVISLTSPRLSDDRRFNSSCEGVNTTPVNDVDDAGSVDDPEFVDKDDSNSVMVDIVATEDTSIRRSSVQHPRRLSDTQRRAK